MCFLQFLLVSKSLFNPSSLSHFFKSIFLSTSYTLFCLITFIIKLSSVLNHIMEIVELKVEMVGIHEKRLRKCLSKLRGIEKVEVDGNSQKVVVTGYAHRNKILKAVRRSGLKAEFWSPQNELLHAYASATSYHHLRFNNFSFF